MKRITAFLILIMLFSALSAGAYAAGGTVELSSAEAVAGEKGVDMCLGFSADEPVTGISFRLYWDSVAVERIGVDIIGPDMAWNWEEKDGYTEYEWFAPAYSEGVEYDGVLFRLSVDLREGVYGQRSVGVDNVSVRTADGYSYTVDSAAGIIGIHSLSYIDGEEPTCTEEGIAAHYFCNDCHRLYTDPAAKNEVSPEALILPKAKHELEHKKAVDPTCMAGGNLEYWRCDSCMKHYLDPNGLTETESVWLDKVGCVATSVYLRDDEAHWMLCKWCGKQMGRTAHVMSWTEDVKPGCTEAGSRHSGCVCGQPGETGEIAPLGHSMSHHEALAPGCTEPGAAEFWSCERCGGIFADELGEAILESTVIPPVGHKTEFVPEKAAGCQHTGTAEHWRCTACGSLFADSAATVSVELSGLSTPIAPHAPGARYCFDEKGHSVLCVYGCGSPVAPAEEHILTSVADETATCSEPGAEHSQCFCGYVSEAVPTDLAPHQLTHHEPKASDCVSHGNIEYWSCDVCAKVFTTAEATPESEISPDMALLPMAEHEPEFYEGYPATCTGTGMAAHYKCTVCSRLFTDGDCTEEVEEEDLELPMALHSTEPVAETPATCTAPGVKAHYKCSVCSNLFFDELATSPATEKALEIPAIPHKPVEQWSMDGEKHWKACEYGCTAKCDLAGHRYGAWKNVKNPEDIPEYRNKQVRYCVDCNYWQLRDRNSNGTPHTGDENLPGLTLAVFALSGVTSIALAYTLKKKKAGSR